jgi:hypothetical protein
MFTLFALFRVLRVLGGVAIFNKKPVPMFTQVRRAQYAVRRRKAFLFVYIDELIKNLSPCAFLAPE